MAFTVRHNAAEGLIEVSYEGTTTREDIMACTRQVFELLRATGCGRTLIDHRGLYGGASMTEVFRLPDVYETLGFDRNSRGAVILRKGESTSQLARFFEDACRNRGWQISSFEDEAAAREWLLK